jgi:hypothetical protein
MQKANTYLFPLSLSGLGSIRAYHGATGECQDCSFLRIPYDSYSLDMICDLR